MSGTKTNKHSCATSRARRMTHQIKCASRQTPICNNKCFTCLAANLITTPLPPCHCKHTAVGLLHGLTTPSGAIRGLIITHERTAYQEENITALTLGKHKPHFRIAADTPHRAASSSGLF